MPNLQESNISGFSTAEDKSSGLLIFQNKLYAGIEKLNIVYSEESSTAISDLSENIPADLQVKDILLTIRRVKIQETRTPSQATALWKTCIPRAKSQYHILLQDLCIILTEALHNSHKTRYEMRVIHSTRIPQNALKELD